MPAALLAHLHADWRSMARPRLCTGEGSWWLSQQEGNRDGFYAFQGFCPVFYGDLVENAARMAPCSPSSAESSLFSRSLGTWGPSKLERRGPALLHSSPFSHRAQRRKAPALSFLGLPSYPVAQAPLGQSLGNFGVRSQRHCGHRALS